MPLQFTLIKSSLTKSANQYVAKSKSSKILKIDDLINATTYQQSGPTPIEVKKVLNHLEHLIMQHLKSGATIELPHCRIYPVVSGVFNGLNDQYDPQRHTIKLRVQPSHTLKQVTSEITAVKTEKSMRKPQPLFIHRPNQLDESTLLAPNHIYQLSGKLLKFNVADNRQGIFMLPVKKPDTAYRLSNYGQIRSTTVAFLIPTHLPSGKYQLEVRAQLPKHKHITRGMLAATLGVQSGTS